MPGSVANAVASTVLPAGLCLAFSAAREYLVDEYVYRNGETQQRLRTATSRKSWDQARPLTAVEYAALVAYFEARKGGTEAFFFYYAYEQASGQPVGSNYDATGVSTQGRYTVRFEGLLEGAWKNPRGQQSLRLVEVA